MLAAALRMSIGVVQMCKKRENCMGSEHTFYIDQEHTGGGGTVA